MLPRVPRRLAFALGCLAFLTLAPQASASDAIVRCAAHGTARGTVLVLPAGGFVVTTSPSYRRARCRPFTTAGFDVVALAYPINDYAAALRFTTDQATRARRAGRPVMIYGESAGATLAEMLAVRGVVPAAAAVAGISDLTNWREDKQPYWDAIKLPTLLARRDASPLHQIGPHPGRLLLLHSLDDESVPFEQSARLAQRLPSASLGVLSGSHLADGSATSRAIAWLRTTASTIRRSHR